MSTIHANDRVKYTGDKDGALEPEAKGTVVQVGGDTATVDFGPDVGQLYIKVKKLEKVG